MMLYEYYSYTIFFLIFRFAQSQVFELIKNAQTNCETSNFVRCLGTGSAT